MKLGRYSLVKTIARGGMGEVFLAQPDEGGPLVAIKRVLPVLEDNEDIIDMFTDEVRITTLLKHENLAQAYGVERADDSVFLVMEYIPGKDLQRICVEGVQRGPFLPLRIACKIISLAAVGLHHAHNLENAKGEALHLVHRDVSPPNIMVSFSGDVKMIDFGIALADDNIAIEGDEHFKGKFGYMSPEQVRGERIDRRSDVFALGTILYEITAQTRLFRAKTQERAHELIVDAHIVPPTLQDPNYPEALETIVMCALARDTQIRFQSAWDLHRAIESYLESSGGSINKEQIASYMDILFEDNTSTVIPTMPQLQALKALITKDEPEDRPPTPPPSSAFESDPSLTPIHLPGELRRRFFLGFTVVGLVAVAVGIIYLVATSV